MHHPSPLRRRLSTALALSPFATALPAFGQATLPKTITLLVPQAAGGSNDVMARAVAARLPQVLGAGYSAIVENRTGAGGNVGTAYVAKQAPRDGSVWLVTVNSTQAINDFEPVAAIALVQHAILAAPNLPINTLAELVAAARKEPGKYSYGSAGNGTFSHLLMEMLKKSQGLQMTHVPYRGVAPALTDLVAGNLHYLISTIPACLQFIKAGQVKALAVPSLHRAPSLPNVPLANEAVPGLVGELQVLMYAPKGVPREHIEQMRRAVAAAQALPEMETFLTAQGATALKGGPAEVEKMTKEELGKWGPVVREAGLKVD
jgi:tripartite-type tricarboxylate transporter receptor subunit TctC